MIRSFRVRLALMAALMSGLVLGAFGLVAWWNLNRSRQAAMDTELEHFGYRVALRTGKNVDRQRLDASLVDIYGADKASHRFFALLAADGTLLHQTARWPDSLRPVDFPGGTRPLDPQPVPREVRRPDESTPPSRIVMEPRYDTVMAEGVRYRIGVFANPDVVLVLGADLHEFARDMRLLRRAFLAALPGALFIVALGAALVAWRALRPVEVLSRDMKRVSAQDLNHRLDISGADREFEGIIRNYNAMLERLERSFHQASRFSADASHELKTPLAVMQGTLERALSRCQDNAETSAAFSEVLEQTGRQRSILESLLLLSRADAGRLEVTRERVPFSDLLHTWLEDASFLAEPRGIAIRSEIEPGVELEGDPVLLQRVAHNLFSNAVRYNRDGGELECILSAGPGEIVWVVANTGEPIPAADRERIFERFIRSAPADAEDEGAGLGLSLVREIIQAHGGSIQLDDPVVDGLTRFRIRIPRS